MGKEGAEGESRPQVGAGRPGTARKGQKLHNPALLDRGCPSHLGTEATGSTSGQPPERTFRYMCSWQSWGPQSIPNRH